ncbi:MAG: VCBS repeat-containing protein [Bernardetiaceae bacterium]|nr:VCBS repeat-containing protein [Bernardetiaceae bacterium]
MQNHWFSVLTLAAGLAGLASCQTGPAPRFELLASARTGVAFNNQVAETDSFNILQFEYIYNGAGVGIGDFDGNGQPDLFFAGNQVSSRLYLNQGDFRFADATEAAGVTTRAWCTGVAVVDINQDGRPDVHVSTIHPRKQKKEPNLFFLNKGNNAQGVPQFEEVAARLGLADSGYSTQAAFLDHDRDGDLDMYLLNNALEDYFRNLPLGQKRDGTGRSLDKLYRNDGPGPDGLPRFSDVSRQAGILAEGWGLGIVVNDVNQDGWPDVFVANDFLSTDHLYINNRNGTFTDSVQQYFRHLEYNGMGADLADFNNDGLNDLVVTDMMPYENQRQKVVFGNTGYDRFETNLRQNYGIQYVRNTLQISNGRSFSDVGYLTDTYATEWSWSALFADLDNDSHRDLLITNGYRKDITDLDFITYANQATQFGTDETRKQTARAELEKLEGVLRPNFLFQNLGNLQFANRAPAWGLDQAAYTNGAAYVDLDQDGDLDLVMSNLNSEAFIYRNNLINRELSTADSLPPTATYLRVHLRGQPGNREGLGAKLWLYGAGQTLYAEHQCQRGYKSSVENVAHFGLGRWFADSTGAARPAARIDSLRVIWPSGRTQVLRQVAPNQVLVLNETEATVLPPLPAQAQNLYFEEFAARSGLQFKPQEEVFVDFKNGQALLPRLHSQTGPPLATGDLNGDGLADLLVGGPARQPATVFYQQPGGRFARQPLAAKTAEDTGLLIFDADNDGDQDIYCVSGSTEFGKQSPHYQDRLYRNQGRGRFGLDTAALPRIEASGSVATAADFDRDGDLDLFVGGRVQPGQYPLPPRSYLLQNNGRGQFTDVTAQLAPGLVQPGMVAAALWADYDGDTWPDLLLAGEYLPLSFFRNEKGQRLAALAPLPHSTGWWNSLATADFDRDGDPDFVAGNLGLNSIFKASPTQPVCVYAKDYDQNGTVDPILCRYVQGREHPHFPRETMTSQLVSLRQVLVKYAQYGQMGYADLLPEKARQDALVLKADQFASVYIENLGQGQFAVRPLPVEAQLAPLYGLAPTDVDGDGHLDLLAVGNDYAADPLTGRYDALTGLVLRGNGKGQFTALPSRQTGFWVTGDAKSLVPLPVTDDQPLWVAGQNQDSLRVFRQRRPRP